MTPQEKWNKIVNACQTTAAEIAPKEKKKGSESEVIMNLVRQQK